MPVPKKRTPKGRRNKRRSHHALSAIQLDACSSCGSAIKPHHACPTCGTYKGRSVVEGSAGKDAALAERKAFRKQATEEHEHDHDSADDSTNDIEAKSAEKEDTKKSPSKKKTTKKDQEKE